MSTVKTRIETITPAKAMKWMQNAQNIRSLRKNRVAAWEEKLRRGLFEISNDAICLDVNGNLINGWHRLTAVINTGISFDGIVAYDMPVANVHVMDKGLKRAVSDSLANPEHRTTIAAASKMILGWRLGIVHNSNKMQTQVPEEEVIEFADTNHPDLVRATKNAQICYKEVGGTVTSWTTFFYEADQISPAKAEQFYEAIRTGANLKVGDPRLAARNWFAHQLLATRRRSTIPNSNALHIMAQGWNAWINGDKRDKLHLPRKNAKNLAVPQLVKP